MSKLLLPLLFVSLLQSAFAEDAITVNYKMSAKDINAYCPTLLQKLGSNLESIKNNKDEATFANTVEALEFAISESMMEGNDIDILGYVSPSKEVRDASTACVISFGQFMVGVFTDMELFARVKKVQSSKEYEALDQDQKRLVDDYYKGFVANGLGVEDEKTKIRIAELNKELIELSNLFSKNIQEVKDHVWVTKQELDGLEESFIEALEKKKDKYKLTSDYPVLNPVMKYAKNPEVRKKMLILSGTEGGKENVQLLENMILRRDEIAKLMGYENHAERVIALSDRMAKGYAEIRTFLDGLIQDLKPAYQKEFDVLKTFKCKDTNCKSEKDVVIEPWDRAYYSERVVESQGDLDVEKIKEYFPIEHVTESLFSIYEKLLGIEIKEAQTDNKWINDVEYFEVFDAKSHKKIGVFYLDMFPREGKYSHAAHAGLHASGLDRKGDRIIPLSVLMCNFNPSTKDRPSLLTHNEVETYFHEFGHLMHNMVSKVRYQSQGGTAVAKDFVEAPSQMLENWVWRKEPLQLLSKHYQTGKSLPDDMLQQMLKLKKVNQALFYTRQLALASIDMDYHTMKTPIDTTKVWNDRFESLTMIKSLANVYPQASFGHMNGYDAGYYGYLWSEVYALDMFSVFEKKGIMNSVIGLRYRREILEPGGSKDLNRQLKRFLRREPNNKAFLKNLGL